MIELLTLQSLLHSLQITTAPVTVVKLAGDASNRTYYRVSWKTASGSQSLVLMALAAPEPFKQSEEAVSGPPPSISELPFINIQRHLKISGAPVPNIVHYDEKQGWILLEDLGDTTFAQALDSANTETVLMYYKKAIDLLIHIQHVATPAPETPTFAHSRCFDQSLFTWEFDHFIEYGIEKREGILLPEKSKTALRAFFSEIALKLAMLPRVLTHRDYHSRNLMIQYDPPERKPSSFKIRVIDFQDALMGPASYDLASLLRDSYINLSDAMINTLLLYYLEGWEHQTGEKIAEQSFREQFDLISLQRNLKAAGRFVYIDQVKKNASFLPFVTPTLVKVKQNLEKNRRLRPLYDLLSEYIRELR